MQSKRAIHQSTLFDSSLENDPHALWFYGRLVCPYIDDLCNEFDDCLEKRLPHSENNPTSPLDPSRRSGLNREHPFVNALFAEALARLRPLIEEERKREEGERAMIESEATRKRLNALEKAAHQFINEHIDDDEPSREPDERSRGGRFIDKGYSLNPPFVQIVKGHSQLFWLNIRQESYPEFDSGSTVQIECLSNEIESDKHYCGLEPHPVQSGVVRAIWKIKALSACSATGVRARIGPITAESMIEVLDSEADRYKGVVTLQFSKKRYTIRTDQKRKKIRIYIPITLAPNPTTFHIEVDSEIFEIIGQPILNPKPVYGISICELLVKCKKEEGAAVITARSNDLKASASIVSIPPISAGLSIQLLDIDLANQRYRWRHNVLEIAARHPSLRRYLGDNVKDFDVRQELKHFRVLLAEIVADAVCSLIVSRYVRANQDEFENADWDQYYALYCKYLTSFLPIAHKLQCPET